MGKKILFLAFRYPVPAINGYNQRVYNYCKMLKSLGNEIDLFFISDGKDYLEHQEEANKIFSNIYPVVQKKYNIFFSLLKSFFTGQSLQENYYISGKGHKELASILEKNDYDILISSYIRMFKYIKEKQNYIKLLDFTDSIAFHYQESINKAVGIWKYIYKYEFEKVKKFEKQCLEESDQAIITSPLDKEFILDGMDKKYEEKIQVFPQGVNEKLIQRLKNHNEEKKVKVLSFIGTLNYYPNVDAIINFCKEVLPLIKEKVIIKIIGKNPVKEIIEATQNLSNVELTGFVDDPYEILIESDMVIAPMRLGGGIQNKILEGMALGRPVITFSGREKPIMGTKHNENIIVANDNKDMAEKIDYYLNNGQKAEEIGVEARNLISKNYTWNGIEKSLSKLVMSFD